MAGMFKNYKNESATCGPCGPLCGPHAFENLVSGIARMQRDGDDSDETAMDVANSEPPETYAVLFLVASHLGQSGGDPAAFGVMADTFAKLLTDLAKQFGPALIKMLQDYLSKRFGLSAESASIAATTCAVNAVMGFVAKQPLQTIILNLLTCLAQAGLRDQDSDSLPPTAPPPTPTPAPAPAPAPAPTDDLFRTVKRC